MANDFNTALFKHRSNRISNRGGPQLVGIDDPIIGTKESASSNEPLIPFSTKALAIGVAGFYLYFKLFGDSDDKDDTSWGDWIHKKITLSKRYRDRRTNQKKRAERKSTLAALKTYGPHGRVQEWGKPWR